MTISVPFFDWAGLWAERAHEFGRIMTETAARGGFILQRDVDEFEEKLSEFLGVKHVIALSDGTNAMLLGLRACGVKPGDEIIVPSHGFIAAAQAIHFAGATPVPVEMSEFDWLIDPADVARAVTSKTVGIMPVHVNGRVCDMDALQAIADECGLQIFEDAAQAAGARYKDRPSASFGKWGTYSFYPSKTLGSFGDAGALATDNDDVAHTVRTMRNHGAGPDKSIPKDVAIWGTNSRLDNLHAAILLYKLSYYQEAIDRRRQVAARYHEALSDIDELRLPPPPVENGDHYDIFQNYELRAGGKRDALRAHLAENRVGTIVQWGGTGMHQFRGLGFTQDLPRTDAFFRESLLLPMNHILSEDQVEHVIVATRGFFGR
jgi:dTDP-4-amino-4,6-dideoxygalactose transaminase